MAATAIVAIALWRRRFRLLISLAAGAMVAGGALAGILNLVDGGHPDTVAASLGHGSWLASAAFPGPALLAGVVAVTVAASPWLSRPWRRTAWIVLGAAGVARLVAGTVLPMELILALAAGLTAGAGVLVALGVPDRRIGPDGIAAALRSAGLPVSSVTPADVTAKGSRPFFAVTEAGRRLFIKAVGSDQRDADLLYRAYRFARLRDVGDTRPAASLIQAVEHQALVGTLAERAGVRVPRVDRVIKAADGTVLLAMERVDGSPLDQLPAQLISDELLRRLWAEVDRLHRAGIAHRALRAANVVVDGAGQPWLTDFSFSDLTATQRQMDIDLAELMASLATLVGADRTVSGATAVIGAPGSRGRGTAAAAPGPVGRHPPLDRPARGPAGENPVGGSRSRWLRGPATGPHPAGTAPHLGDDSRPRGRLLLPPSATGPGEQQLARHPVGALGVAACRDRHVGADLPGWRGLLAGRRAGTGAVLAHCPGPSGLFFHQPGLPGQRRRHGTERPLPAEIRGRPVRGVAAVGLSALAGAIVHVILLVIFFVLASRNLAHAFKVPPASKLLLILAVVAALIGIVLATRRGRRFATTRLQKVLRSAFGSLRQVAASPAKLILLVGGSALVTLAYFGGLAASVQAFGGGIGIAEIGAVYMAASAIAAASPTPGGLGAIEAALVAGLTGVGLGSGPAVSAVLTYRLATYWLPVAPGWIALHALQRRDYV